MRSLQGNKPGIVALREKQPDLRLNRRLRAIPVIRQALQRRSKGDVAMKTIEIPMPRHKVVSREEWLKARVVKSTAAAAPYLKGMEAGLTQSLERLAAFVVNA